MTRFLILLIWKLRYISIIIIIIIIIIVAIAEVYKNEGNDEYKKSNFNNAIQFYTEGIEVNCKDEELNAKLYSNRAAANLNLGKKLKLVFYCCEVFWKLFSGRICLNSFKFRLCFIKCVKVSLDLST